MTFVFRRSLPVLFVATVLAGCGGSGGDSVSSGATPTSQTTPTPIISPSASPTATPTPAPDTTRGQAPIPATGLVPVSNAAGQTTRISPATLPPPYDTPSASNGPSVSARPDGTGLTVPPGFYVYAWANNLTGARTLITAPNGDIFLAQSSQGRITVLRDADRDGVPETRTTFAEGRNFPFGMALYPSGPNPQWLYVAETNRVVRYPYTVGSLAAGGSPQVVVDGLPTGGHSTRGIAFNPSGTKMYVSVGSNSNVAEEEERRAAILEFNPDGSGYRVFASGLRNPVHLAVHPQTGALWTSVNERDGLGDNLVPDYLTSVADSGFYGWPYYYIGANHDPRMPDRSELASRSLVPSLLFQSHSAPLGFCFYTGNAFPADYTGNAFVALHGSWNRVERTGYKIVRVRLDAAGQPMGAYEDFMTGWQSGDTVWGRPVGVTAAGDGSLLVSDDGAGVVWRVTYGLTPPASRKTGIR